MSVTSTAAPSLASRFAVASPIPLAAPVTSATRPSSLSIAELPPHAVTPSLGAAARLLPGPLVPSSTRPASPGLFTDLACAPVRTHASQTPGEEVHVCPASPRNRRAVSFPADRLWADVRHGLQGC